jgi:peptide chain release factor 3
VGLGPDFEGVVDRRGGSFYRFQRTARGAAEAPEEALERRRLRDEGREAAGAAEELDLLDIEGADLDRKSFLAGESTPVFFGSALWNFGVRLLLDALIDLAPGPEPTRDAAGRPLPLGAPFSGQVFKVQANLDLRHRDRLAFVRVRSGRFERGMTVTLARTGRPFATSYAHQMFGRERETLNEAFPGDVVGLVNARDLRLGDTLYIGDPAEFAPIPSFAPEHFARARAIDPARFKRFRRGLAQLEEEGVIQVLRHPDLGDQAPVLAAVGPMQYDVARHRMEREFGVPIELETLSYSLARRTDEEGARTLSGRRGAHVLFRRDGAPLALFESEFWLEQARKDHPGATLEPLFSG